MSDEGRGRRTAILAGIVGGAIAVVVGAVFMPADKPQPPDAVPMIPAQLMVVPVVEPSSIEPGSLVILDEPDASATSHDAGSPPSGCGLAQRPGTWEHRLPGGDVVLHVPRKYQPDRHHRLLIVVFSETLRSVAAFLNKSGLERLADEHDLVIIGARQSEDPSTSTTEHLLDAVRHTSQRVCLDENYRYAIGHGIGGRWVRDLRCQMPLSAMVTTGDGHKVGDVICQSEPTPFLHVVGTKDARVPMAGGKGCYSGPYLSAARIEADWAARNECEGRARTWVRHDEGACRIWTCTASLAICELEGGHDWPGATGAVAVPGCDHPPADFPLAETVWAFFAEHGREI